MFDTFRDVLQNGSIGNRGQYIVEALFSIRRAGFAASEHPVSVPRSSLQLHHNLENASCPSYTSLYFLYTCADINAIVF